MRQEKPERHETPRPRDPDQYISLAGWFREQYAHARAWQADHYMDEMIEIADGVRGGCSRTSVRAAKLAIDARKWMLARLMPKKYDGRHARIRSRSPGSAAKT